jgi:hypothetical protein
MRAFFIIVLWGCFLPHLDGASWDPDPPLPIASPTSVERTSNSNVFSAFDAATGTFLSTWQDVDGAPYFAFYDGTGWTMPTSIDSSAVAYGDVFPCATGSGTFLATWVDNSTSSSLAADAFNATINLPIYSYYDGTSWSAPAAITDAGSAYYNVFTSFDPSLGTAGAFLATWKDVSSETPFYSLIEVGPSLTSTSATQIPISQTVYSDVTSSFNATTGEFFITWLNDIGNSFPDYSPIYDTVSFASVTTPVWGTPAFVAGYSGEVANNVYSACNPSTNEYLVVWNEYSHGYPYYSIYNAASMSWSPSSPKAISNLNISSSDVIPSFDPITGNFLATWLKGRHFYYGLPYYSILSGGTWTSAKIPDSMESSSDVACACNTTTGQFLVTWVNGNADSLEKIPYYSIYTETRLPPPPPTPKNFSAKQKTNHFLFQEELFNVLTWKKSPGAKGYLLYRDGVLIATLGANARSFTDYNPNDQPEDYILIAFNQFGNSQPATASIE